MFSFSISLAFALSGGTLLVWLAVLGLAAVVTEWLPKQVIVSRAGDRMVPPQTAIAANLVAAIWMALLLLTWHTMDLYATPPADDWMIVSPDAIAWLILIVMAPVSLVVVPMLVAALAIPLVGCLLRPVEWLVSRSSVRDEGRPAAVAAVLALLSGFATSLVLMLLPLLDAGNSARYLPMQCSLAPFGLLTWLCSRVINSR